MPETPYPHSCPLNLTHSWRSFSLKKKKKKKALCITHFHKTDHLLSTDFISFYLRKFFVTLSLTENYKWFPAPVDFEQMDDPDARFTILESDIVLKESFIYFG